MGPCKKEAKKRGIKRRPEGKNTARKRKRGLRDPNNRYPLRKQMPGGEERPGPSRRRVYLGGRGRATEKVKKNKRKRKKRCVNQGCKKKSSPKKQKRGNGQNDLEESQKLGEMKRRNVTGR